VSIVFLVAALAGCGGGDESAAPVSRTTSAPPASTAETARAPSLGCDVVAVCLPEVAHELLERCPASRLSPDGRHARRRLEKALDQVEKAALHNKLADEASEAALVAVSRLERECA
jgi:hypothetical protein